MKLLLFLGLSAIFMLPLNNPFAIKTSSVQLVPIENNKINEITFQDDEGSGKMSATVFKAQEFCRAEVKDFEFETPFTIVSATVYFSGGNFKQVEKGSIVSNKLKPIADLMKRCSPGTRVVFDDIKVIGPDKQVRKIQGVTYMLY